MSKAKLLIVDDEPGIVKVLQTALNTAGYDTLTANTGEEALELLENHHIELLVVDLRLGKGMNGIELIKTTRQRNLLQPAIMITAYGTIDVAVKAMKHGAFDFICKPFEIKELLTLIEAALQQQQNKESTNRPPNVLSDVRRHFGSLIGDSDAMQKTYRLIERVAPTNATVLIQGESGTGKELVAQAIHQSGNRHDTPWVALNCAAIPTPLLESEMFGHKAGAFTGSGNTDRQGLFATASGGTLFLDEIGVMDLGLQGKLLRALQESKIRPVGANEDIPVDVRVLAATNEDLENRVRTGEFREDLFYRINVIPLHLPPLRERGDDIDLLARFFCHVQSDSLGMDITMAPAALLALKAYTWPGNVRELQNAIACAATLCENGFIQPLDLPPRILAQGNQPPATSPERSSTAADTQTSLKEFLRQKEQEYIESVLQKTGGNRAKAADLLGISRATFYRKYENATPE